MNTSKNIDDYRLQYLNGLLGIKFFLRSELKIATFRICMDATFFSMSPVINFLLITPFIFREHSL